MYHLWWSKCTKRTPEKIKRIVNIFCAYLNYHGWCIYRSDDHDIRRNLIYTRRWYNLIVEMIMCGRLNAWAIFFTFSHNKSFSYDISPMFIYSSVARNFWKWGHKLGILYNLGQFCLVWISVPICTLVWISTLYVKWYKLLYLLSIIIFKQNNIPHVHKANRKDKHIKKRSVQIFYRKLSTP